MAEINEIINRIITEAQVVGFEQATRAYMDLARANAGLTDEMMATVEVTDKTDKSFTSLAGKAENLKRKHIEGYKAVKDFETIQRQLSLAVEQGAISTEQAATILANFGQRNLAAARASRELAMAQSAGAAGFGTWNQSARIATAQLTQFSYQLNDIITMAASGSGLGQIIGTQAGQIFQIFQQGQGSFGQQVRGLGSQIAGLITPTRLLAGAAVGTAVAAVTAWSSWRDAQDDLAASLMGVGRASGATLGQLQRVAQEGAAAGRVSLAASQGAAGAYAGAGMAPSGIQGLIGITRTYARVIGGDFDAATEELAKAFTDPLKGAEALNERLGFLDATTRQYIKTLIDQNDIHGAQSALLKALQEDLQDTEERTNALGKAWEWLKRLGSDTWTGFGSSVDRMAFGAPPEEELAKLLKAREEAQRLLQSGAPAYQGGAAVAEAEIRRLNSLIAPLQQQVDQAKREAERRAAEQRSARISLEGNEAVRRAMPQFDEFERLKAARKDIKDMLNDPNTVAGMSSVDVDRARRALDAYTQAIDTYLSASTKATQSEQLAINSIQARTVAERAAIAMQETRLSLSGQIKDATDREARAQAAAAEVIARATREADEHLRQVRSETALAGLYGYARGLAQINREYEEQIALQQGNEAGIRKLTEARTRELEAYKLEAVVGPVRGSAIGLNGDLGMLRARRDSFGGSTAEVEAALEKQRLFNEYLAAGIPITKELAAAIDEVAQRTGLAAEAAEELAYRQGEVIGIMDSMRDATRDGIGGLFKDLSRGKNPLEGLINVGQRFADSLIDQFSQDFAGNLLGPDGSAGGGLFGGPIGKALASALGVKDVKVPENLSPQMVAQMAVQAGTVIVNGAVPGLSGFGAPANSNVAGGFTGLGPAAPVQRGTLPPLVAPNVRTGGIGSDSRFPLYQMGGIGSDARFPLAGGPVPNGMSFGGVTPSAETLGLLNRTALAYGINPQDFATLARIESAFDPFAVNGQHRGMFQFSNSTGASYGIGSASARFDPALSADAAARLWMDNSRALQPILGRPATGWEAYVAHQQGIGGAGALFGNPDMNAAAALNTLPYYANRPGLANLAITGNGGTLDMTSAQFLDVWKSKFEAMGGSLESMTQASQSATTGLGDLSKMLGQPMQQPGAQPAAGGGMLGFGGGGGMPLGLSAGMFTSVPFIPATATNPAQFAGVGPGLWPQTMAMQGIGGIGTDFLGGLGQGLQGIVAGIGQIAPNFLGGFGGVLQSLLGGLSQLGGGGAGGGGGGFLGGIFSLIGGIFGFAEGGRVGVKVSNGEYAVPPDVAAKNKGLLDAINFGGLDLSTPGLIRGAGTGTSDSIFAMAPAGTYIVNAAATRKNRAVLDGLNDNRAGLVRHFREGGNVTSLSSRRTSLASDRAARLSAMAEPHIAARNASIDASDRRQMVSSSYRLGDVHIAVEGNADHDTLAAMEQRLSDYQKNLMKQLDDREQNRWRGHRPPRY